MKQRVAYAWAVVLLAVALHPSVCSAFTTESLEEVVQVAYDFGRVEVKAGAGNGSTDEIGDDDTIDLYYGHIEVVPAQGSSSALLGSAHDPRGR